jgi:hypothetical protein
VSGDGPLELVVGIASGIPIDLLSEDPGFVRLRRRLGSFSRLAEHIPNAKFVVLPGDDHLFFVGDTDALALSPYGERLSSRVENGRAWIADNGAGTSDRPEDLTCSAAPH